MITVCGEALIDLVAGPDGRYTPHLGGSPYNVAVGLARLEAPTSFLGRLGADSFGSALRTNLEENGVDLRDAVAGTENTTLAVATLDERGGATYGFYVQGTADWQWAPGELPDPLADDVTALHTGSLASWLPPGHDLIEALLRRERERGAVTVSYDPNVRPLLMADRDRHLARIERFVALAHLVKVSDEDLRWLYPDVPVEAAAAEWAARGPGLVLLTLGGDGAVAVTSSGVSVRRPGRTVEVADTVGAGDSFMSATLAWLDEHRIGADDLAGLAEDRLGALLDFAGEAAAITCSRPGANPPHRSELGA